MNRSLLKKSIRNSFFLFLFLRSGIGLAQGVWTPLVHNAPDSAGGVALLLSDGTVISKTFAGGNDGIGNIWDKLTPDANGSYINGTWSQIAPMNRTRLYFSSQVLRDGRVYCAGGEYGTGGGRAEVYNPKTNVWTSTPNPGHTISDANSEILPDGKVLNALVEGNLDGTMIYDPKTNTFSTGPTCLGIHNESVWVKLADNSILFVDRLTTSSERFIPSLNQWVADAIVPVGLYDPYGDETGGAVLLPDGRAFFVGAPGTTAYYTPSGNNSPGTWTAGPSIPNSQGTPDASIAMMNNGKILLCVSPAPTSSSTIFDPPTSYYEFNYLTNSYIQLNAPGGGLTVNEPCYTTNMLQLPDGNILYSQQDSVRYFVYTPSSAPLAAGKPTIGNILSLTSACDTFRITGTLFNGITEGCAYGDDWQNETNYPLVRLKNGPLVYYCKTFNWNRTSVMTGNLADTAFFTLPVGLPQTTYQLFVVANGNPSLSVSFTPCIPVSVADEKIQENYLSVYPNPAKDKLTIELLNENFDLLITDVTGREIIKLNDQNEHTELDCSAFPNGVYFIQATDDQKNSFKKKFIIAK